MASIDFYDLRRLEIVGYRHGWGGGCAVREVLRAFAKHAGLDYDHPSIVQTGYQAEDVRYSTRRQETQPVSSYVEFPPYVEPNTEYVESNTV